MDRPHACGRGSYHDIPVHRSRGEAGPQSRDQSVSDSNSADATRRAGASGGGRAGSPRHSRIASAVSGGWIAARILIARDSADTPARPRPISPRWVSVATAFAKEKTAPSRDPRSMAGFPRSPLAQGARHALPPQEPASPLGGCDNDREVDLCTMPRFRDKPLKIIRLIADQQNGTAFPFPKRN